MTADEIKLQLETLKNNLEKDITAKAKAETEAQIKALEAKLPKADETIKKELDEAKAEIKTMKDAAEKNQTALDSLIADQKTFYIGGKHKEKKAESLGDQVSGRIIKSLDEIGQLKKGQWVTLSHDPLERKVAGTMTTTNIDAVGTDSIPYLLSSTEPGLTRIARRSPFLMQLCNIGSINKMYAQWAEQANPDPGAAGSTAEGLAKTQTDFDIQEKSQKVEKVTAYIKVSTEMLDDVDFMRSEINNELVELIMLKADQQIYEGNGTSPQLKGILSSAQSISFGALAGTILDANKLDALRAAYAQIATNQFTTPTEIVMHPEDAASLDLEKGTDGHYIMPPFSTANRATVKGVPIVENTLVTAGNFLIGDFTKSNVRIRKALSISVGYENDDFTKNLVTILAEMRLVHYIKTNHVNGFVYDSFVDAIANLDAGS